MPANAQKHQQPNQNDEGQGHQDNGHPGGISAAEWVIAAVGLVLVVGVIATLSIEALRDTGRPPSITVDVLSTTSVEGGYVVELSVLNDGDETAADVTIVGQLTVGGDALEEHEMALDYVPPHSARRGGIFFSNDPTTGTLTFQPEGYQKP